MGVDRSTHLVYGWKLPEPIGIKDGQKINPYEDEFLPYVEGHRGINEIWIHDQMMGNYNVFGTNLGHLSEDDEGEFHTVNVSQLNPDVLREKFKKIFGIDAPKEDPEILFFIHCS